MNPVSIVLLSALLLPFSALAQEGIVRVTGGAQAEMGAWPDAAGVAFGQGYIGCTGTLIAPTVVLTAGHCVEDRPTWVVLDTNDYQRTEGEWIRVQSVYEYPNSWQSYDIAVLVLSEPATVEPRLVAQGCILDEALYDGAPVAIVGYGAIDAYGNQYTTKLMEGFSVVTDPDCVQTNRGCNSSVSPGGEIGAGQDGVDACYGDSGGPLYLLTDYGDYVIGVTSRAYWDVRVDCGEGGIWVRPDAVIDWIEEKSGVQIPVPTCNLMPDPIAEDLRVPKGRTRDVVISANDEDQAEGHIYQIVEAPEFGTLQRFNDGMVVKYTAPKDYLGPDPFVLAIVDEGVPAHEVEFEVQVEVIKRGVHLCGCNAPATPVSGLWLGGLGLLLLRRRRSTSRTPC